MIYGSIRVHTGPYGPIFVARGEKSQVKKVKINISDRDFFLGLFRGDPTDDRPTDRRQDKPTRYPDPRKYRKS